MIISQDLAMTKVIELSNNYLSKNTNKIVNDSKN